MDSLSTCLANARHLRTAAPTELEEPHLPATVPRQPRSQLLREIIQMGGSLVFTPPPPQPHPGAAGRKSGKSCRDLAKCLGSERRGPSRGAHEHTLL